MKHDLAYIEGRKYDWTQTFDPHSKKAHESLSHRQIRHAYDILLSFPHELIMNFRNIYIYRAPEEEAGPQNIRILNKVLSFEVIFIHF